MLPHGTSAEEPGPPRSRTPSGTRDDDRVVGRATAVLARILSESDSSGLYAGPWWRCEPIHTEPGMEVVPMWKCAILRRRPRGAEHLGHLFLRLGAEPIHVAPAALLPTPADRFGEARVLLSHVAGEPIQIVARPLRHVDPQALFGIASRLADRLGTGPE